MPGLAPRLPPCLPVLTRRLVLVSLQGRACLEGWAEDLAVLTWGMSHGGAGAPGLLGEGCCWASLAYRGAEGEGWRPWVPMAA